MGQGFMPRLTRCEDHPWDAAVDAAVGGVIVAFRDGRGALKGGARPLT